MQAPGCSRWNVAPLYSKINGQPSLGGKKAGQMPCQGRPRFLVRAGTGLCGPERLLCLSSALAGWTVSHRRGGFPSPGLEDAERNKHHAHSSLKPPFFCVRDRNKETRCYGIRGELRRRSETGSYSKVQAREPTSEAQSSPGTRHQELPETCTLNSDCFSVEMNKVTFK